MSSRQVYEKYEKLEGPWKLVGLSEDSYLKLTARMRELRLAILAGGPSSEADVSRQSALAVKSALETIGYNPELIDFRKPRELVERLSNCDICFVALHGQYGEDGHVQGLLESLGIPYTGSDLVGSVLGMHKAIAYVLLEKHGLRVPRTIYLLNLDKRKAVREALELMRLHGLWFPVVVKPSASGSTVGVSVVREISELESAIENAMAEHNEILIQEYIEGRELTITVIDGFDNTLRTLPPLEIVPETGFYDYRAKYLSEKTRYIVPAELEPRISIEMEKMAKYAFRILRARHLVRADFRLSKEGIPYFLELNTIPGMTSHSLVPKAASAVGISFPQLVEAMLVLALKYNNSPDSVG